MVKRRSYKAAIKKLRPFVKGAVAGTVTAAVFTVIGAFLFNIADAPSGADPREHPAEHAGGGL